MLQNGQKKSFRSLKDTEKYKRHTRSTLKMQVLLDKIEEIILPH